MAKTLTFQNVVLCDFATESENGKHTLVNVYSGSLILATLPIDLHCSLYIEMVNPKPLPGQIRFQIRLAGEDIGSIHFNLDAIDPDVRAQIGVMLAQRISLRIERPGDLEVFASADGYEQVLILKKEVTSPNVSPPPSSLFPTAS